MIAYREESRGVVSVCLFGRPECEALVERLRSSTNWTAARVREARDRVNYKSLAQPEVRSASTLIPDDAEELCRQFDFRMNSRLKPLIKETWRVDLADHSGTHFVRYGSADHYVPHQDTGPSLERRYFSVVCYLNDDFTGGETVFPGLGYAVTPETGKAIVFPSDYLHGSKPVISGEKFVLVSWIEGPTPIKWI